MTGTSIGFGDVSPATATGRWAASLALPFSVMFVGAQLGSLGEALFGSDADEKLAELLKVDLSLEALLAMDGDGDGEITEFEFIKFMLVK